MTHNCDVVVAECPGVHSCFSVRLPAPCARLWPGLNRETQRSAVHGALVLSLPNNMATLISLYGFSIIRKSIFF